MTDHILGNITADHLRSFVERIEAVQEQIDDLNDDKKDIYAEAKGNGFNTKALKAIVAERRKDPVDKQEFETILDLYRSALGMG